MDTGTVKFFDGREGKRFGFLVVDSTNEELFFHFNDWTWIAAGKREPEFNSDFRILGHPNAKPVEPKKGDRIAFQRTPTPRESKACPWMYESMYQRVAEQIRKRPPEPMYRLMYRSSVIGKPLSGPSVIWEGTDLSHYSLPTHFNPVYDRGGMFSNDDINVKKYWEVSMDNGKTWMSCDTPAEYKAMFDSRGKYLKRRW